ncbi:MAG: dihydroorotase [Propionibacteriaceae bacterium]|jgi:dihydroorotase|nr:dihydroorotase [Propionibacteriaceae bacterium]
MDGLLIRGVALADWICPTRDGPGDLAVAGERLVDPGSLVSPRVVDGSGLIALPGLVDLHCHLRQPGQEQAETVASGTAAAARGGYTAVCAMPNLYPVTDTPERAQAIAQLGRRDGAAEVVPIGAISLGQQGQRLADLAALHRLAGVRLFSDDGHCVQSARLMSQACAAVAGFGGVLAQHSQDSDLADSLACCHSAERASRLGLEQWPATAESVIVARDVQLAAASGARLHVCHVSSGESVEIVRWAKARGVKVTAEVTPHHLLLPDDRMEGGDTTFKVNPPLTDAADIEALRQGLADGVIDAVATDHAPHTPADKASPFERSKPGMLGLEQALAVVIETMVAEGRLDWAMLADRMSHAPAAIAGLGDRQGRPLRPGQPANFVLIDPARRAVVDRARSRSRSRNNPYHGLDLPDPVVLTCWLGRLTHDGLA